MLDPYEGIAPDGTIVTGVARWRVAAQFEPVLGAALNSIAKATPDASVYLYGSVATGQAEVGRSDVDFLAIGANPRGAATLTLDLSARFGGICRGVEVTSAPREDFAGESDPAYGNRAFLRHYCVRLAGPQRGDEGVAYPADARTARGFNGDIAQHAQGWRKALVGDGVDSNELGRRMARKALLAVTGLVSVHDHTWTTDRARAAHRWGEISPRLTADLHTLLAWSDGLAPSDVWAVRRMLDTTVGAIVARFRSEIGLWQVGAADHPDERDGAAG